MKALLLFLLALIAFPAWSQEDLPDVSGGGAYLGNTIFTVPNMIVTGNSEYWGSKTNFGPLSIWRESTSANGSGAIKFHWNSNEIFEILAIKQGDYSQWKLIDPFNGGILLDFESSSNGAFQDVFILVNHLAPVLFQGGAWVSAFTNNGPTVLNGPSAPLINGNFLLGGPGQPVQDSGISRVQLFGFPAPDYLSWWVESNYTTFPILGDRKLHLTFGGPMVWDAASNLFRCYLHSDVSNMVFMSTSIDGYIWSDAQAVLGPGMANTWDDYSVGVPFAWCESAESRPWRMLYIGARNGGHSAIGLATSVDGLAWERADTAGMALTGWVVTNGWTDTGGSIDMGNVFKVESTYYLYFDTIAQPRETYLSTSTNLVDWTWIDSGYADQTFWWGATNAAGAWDYDDATHASAGRCSTTNFGFFCPWVGRWDRPDGTLEYRAYVPSTINSNFLALTCWTSASPLFYPSNRTYQGIAFLSGALYGVVTNSIVDVPRFYCEDIAQDAGRAWRMGSNRVAWVSLNPNYYSIALMIQPAGLPVGTMNPATQGASFDGCAAWFPSTNPAIHLMPTGAVGTVFQCAPGARSVLRDLSGHGSHLGARRGYVAQDGNGALLASNRNACLYFKDVAHQAQWDAVQNDFTIEFTASRASILGAGGVATILSASGGPGKHVTYIYYQGSSGDTAGIFVIVITDTGGTSRNFVTSNFNWANGARHRWAFSCTNGIMFWFKDGALQNVGGTAFNYTIKTQTTADPLILGSDQNEAQTANWDGYIDDVRWSSIGRYNATYTTNILPMCYVTNGYMFTGVYDFGASVSTVWLTLTGSTPPGTAITARYRAASSATNKSLTIGDFSETIAPGRYQQLALILSGTGTNTPVIGSLSVSGLKGGLLWH
jgi:hypothetical protein